MPHTLPGQVSALASLLVCAFALLRGGTPERVGAVTLLTGTLLYGLVQDRLNWLDPQRRLLAIDMVALVVFAVLTTSNRRIWLIPTTALMLLSAALHLVIIYKPNIHGLAYLGLENLLGYGMLGFLAWGTFTVDRMQRLTSRARVTAAAGEADRLVAMHGEDGAYKVAVRLSHTALGPRRIELAMVLDAISARSGGSYHSETSTRCGR